MVFFPSFLCGVDKFSISQILTSCLLFDKDLYRIKQTILIFSPNSLTAVHFIKIKEKYVLFPLQDVSKFIFVLVFLAIRNFSDILHQFFLPYSSCLHFLQHLKLFHYWYFVLNLLLFLLTLYSALQSHEIFGNCVKIVTM